MLRFFRTIRRNYFNKGATAKYLLYAIGEILLVMVGILLALQVNNWNEAIKEKVAEKKVLLDIEETLELNIQKLEDQIESNQRCDRSNDVIISALENKLVYHDSLKKHFGWGSNLESSGFLSIVGYESLKNVGVETIRSDQLKKEIIFLFDDTYQNTIGRISRMGGLHPEIVKIRQERFMRSSGFTFIPFDYEMLLKDDYYLSWVKTIKNNRQWITSSLEESLEETQNVLQLIRGELEKFK